MVWVKLDDQWCESEAVAAAGPLAAWLHVCALSYCNRQLTDGRVPRIVLRRLADLEQPSEQAAELVAAGLWTVEPDGWQIVGYLDTQPSRERVERTRGARQVAGRVGGKRSGEARRSKGEAKPKQVATRRLQANANPDPSRKDGLGRAGVRCVHNRPVAADGSCCDQCAAAATAGGATA